MQRKITASKIDSREKLEKLRIVSKESIGQSVLNMIT